MACSLTHGNHLAKIAKRIRVMACVASHMATTRPRLLKKSGTHQTVAICNVDNFVQTFKLQNKTKYMTSILTLLVVMTKRKIVSYFSILLKKRPCCPTVLKGNQNVVFFLSCFLVNRYVKWYSVLSGSLGENSVQLFNNGPTGHQLAAT